MPAADRPAPTDAPGVWARAIELAAPKPRLVALMSELRLTSLDGDRAEIVCLGTTRMIAERNAAELGTLLGEAAGRRVRVEVREEDAGGRTEAQGEAEPEDAPASVAESAAPSPDEAADHPLVRVTAEVFGARIVRVEPRRDV